MEREKINPKQRAARIVAGTTLGLLSLGIGTGITQKAFDNELNREDIIVGSIAIPFSAAVSLYLLDNRLFNSINGKLSKDDEDPNNAPFQTEWTMQLPNDEAGSGKGHELNEGLSITIPNREASQGTSTESTPRLRGGRQAKLQD